MTIRGLSQRQSVPALVYLVHLQIWPAQRELVAVIIMATNVLFLV